MAKDDANLTIEKSVIVDAWRLAIADKVMGKDMQSAQKMAELTSTIVDFVQKLLREHLNDRPSSSAAAPKKEEDARVRPASVTASAADAGARSVNPSGSSNKANNASVASKLAASMSKLNTKEGPRHVVLLNGNWPQVSRSDVRVLRFQADPPGRVQDQLKETSVLNAEIKSIVCTPNTMWASSNESLFNSLLSLLEFMHQKAPSARIQFLGFYSNEHAFFTKFNRDVRKLLRRLPYVEFVDLDAFYDAKKVEKMKTQKAGGMAFLLTSMLNDVVDAAVEGRPSTSQPANSKQPAADGAKPKAPKPEAPKPPPAVPMPAEKPESAKESRHLYLLNGPWPNVEPQDLRVLRFNEETPAQITESLRVNSLLRGDLSTVFISPSVAWINEPANITAISLMLSLIRQRCPSAKIRVHGFYTLEIGQRAREFNRKLKESALLHPRVGYVDFDGLMGTEEFARVSAKMPHPGGANKTHHTMKLLMQTLIEMTR